MDLLPTIVSRCQHIRFNPISAIKLENLLIDEHGLNREDAVAISAMANGSLSCAQAMITGNWINRRNWILEEMQLLSSRPVGHILALAERLAKDKEAISDALEVIKSWLRDLIIARYSPEKIIHQDIADEIKSVSQNMHVASLLAKLDLIHTTQNSIQVNTNVRLALEVMLMKLARL
jgi:DNA polymerase-3 subunit delta'